MRLALDDLPESNSKRRHASQLARLRANEIGVRGFVPLLEDADRLADVAVGKLVLERHALADITRPDEVLAHWHAFTLLSHALAV